MSVIPWEMYVEIKVADNGKGITERNQADIFRRFYREEEVQEDVYKRQVQSVRDKLSADIIIKQTTAYEIMSGDWSSDVCSSDLR